jgi:hypothetical protein
MGRRVITMFFGPYAPYALTPYASICSHDFKRFERFVKLATSLIAPSYTSRLTIFPGSRLRPQFKKSPPAATNRMYCSGQVAALQLFTT